MQKRNGEEETHNNIASTIGNENFWYKGQEETDIRKSSYDTIIHSENDVYY